MRGCQIAFNSSSRSETTTKNNGNSSVEEKSLDCRMSDSLRWKRNNWRREREREGEGERGVDTSINQKFIQFFSSFQYLTAKEWQTNINLQSHSESHTGEERRARANEMPHKFINFCHFYRSHTNMVMIRSFISHLISRSQCAVNLTHTHTHTRKCEAMKLIKSNKSAPTVYEFEWVQVSQSKRHNNWQLN